MADTYTTGSVLTIEARTPAALIDVLQHLTNPSPNHYRTTLYATENGGTWCTLEVHFNGNGDVESLYPCTCYGLSTAHGKCKRSEAGAWVPFNHPDNRLQREHVMRVVIERARKQHLISIAEPDKWGPQPEFKTEAWYHSRGWPIPDTANA